MPEEPSAMQISEDESVELALRNILGRNLILRSLLTRGYRLVLLAVGFALLYFGLGVTIAILNNSLSGFIHSRPLFVLLLAFVSSMVVACWYPLALLDVLVALPSAFKIDLQMEKEVIRRWIDSVRLPILLMTGVVIALFGVWQGVQTEATQWALPTPYVPWKNWWTVHYQIINAICGMILGIAVQFFVATLLLFRQLFQFEVRLFHYKNLSSLGTFSTGMTIASLVGVALFILLIYEVLDQGGLGIVGIGILGAASMFFLPQLSYQKAVVRAKRKYFNALASLYEQLCHVIEQNSIELKSLQSAKEAVEALAVIEQKIKAIPIWLVDLSDVFRILLSLLAPIGSLVVNALLTRLP